MPDEQVVGQPATPLPVGGEAGQLVAVPTAEALPATATSPRSAVGQAPAATAPEYTSTFIGETHSYITQYIQAADQKAIFLFSAAAALLAFLHQDGASGHWLKALSAWGLTSAITCIAMTALAAAAGFAIAAVVPRLPGDGADLVSFNGISAHVSAEQYAGAVTATSAQTLLSEKARHCHTLARVCRDKYRLLRAAVLLEALGVIATVLYFLFGAVGARGAA